MHPAAYSAYRTILAVDTTEDRLSAALLAGGRLFLSRGKPGSPHDETMFAAVDRLLGKAGLALEDVSAFAAASGPGRFTGIRIGMAFCAVAAERLKAPAVAVSRLEALAFRAKRAAKTLCAVVPGWRDEKFYQLFKTGGGARPKAGSIKAVGPPVWTTLEGWARARPGIEEAGALVVEACPGAEEVLALAAERLKRGRLPPFEPLYLKPAGYERKR